jgi:AraC-like DNA-binding protein
MEQLQAIDPDYRPWRTHHSDRILVPANPLAAPDVSVLSVSSRAMLDACARLGIDTDQILRAARLSRATVEDPDVRIPIEHVEAVWQKAYELSNDPYLALHAIEVLPFGAYRVIDFLALSAPTVGDALAKVSDYFPIIHDVVRLQYAVGNREVTFAAVAPSRPSTITRAYAEYVLAAVFLRTRIATNQRFRLQRVEFSHTRPPDIREHERIFECPVRFGAEACRMVIARDVWDMPRTGGNPDLFSVLETHARMLLNQRPAPAGIVARVHEAIEAELRGGDPKLESIASRLALSPRTLQRRLRNHGVLFNALLDATRFRVAKSYLAEADVAGCEVAYLLGFSEQSAFNRAFKRWSGLTVTEYRRRRGGMAANRELARDVKTVSRQVIRAVPPL